MGAYVKVTRRENPNQIQVRMQIMLKDPLPDDLLIDIFSRLPVKTLIRLRCVCKSWHALVANPILIDTHLNCSRDLASSSNDGYLQYMMFGSSGKQRWCLFSDRTYSNHVELEIPFQCRTKCWKFVNTLNGLVCLSDLLYFGRIIYLWNPSIRKFKTLPCSSIAPQLSNPNNLVVLGFGFHHQTNNYKVVRILYFRDFKWHYIDGKPPQVEVYTLSTNSWRKIEAVVPCFPYDSHSNAFINRSVHWLASAWMEDDHSDMIMSFDIGDEVFREMILPDYYIEECGTIDLLLTVLNESLTLCVYFQDIGDCYIWVMEEYGVVESWTKQFFVVVPPHPTIRRPLGFTKYNELLLEATDRELVYYDLESLEHYCLGIRGTGYTSNLVYFMETLVLLE